MFLDPVTEGSNLFPYVFFWTVDVWAFKPVYDFTFLKFVTLSLGAMRRVLMMLFPLKCTWIPKFVACPFEPFPKSVNVWYYYRDDFVV